MDRSASGRGRELTGKRVLTAVKRGRRGGGFGKGLSWERRSFRCRVSSFKGGWCWEEEVLRNLIEGGGGGVFLDGAVYYEIGGRFNLRGSGERNTRLTRSGGLFRKRTKKLREKTFSSIGAVSII